MQGSRIRPLEEKAIQKLRASIVITSATQCVIELLQNALDAQATSVEIRTNLSKYFIQVTDNGTGIVPEDMKSLGRRYVTSKCHTLEDLRNVKSFGFRGEALASIAEVATLEIVSKHALSYKTFASILRDGSLLQHSEAHHGQILKSGTIVYVRDLFYKFPIRRKCHVFSPTDFFTSANNLSGSASPFDSELELMRRTIESTALVFPEVTFTLIDESRDVKVIGTKKTSSMISMFRQLFGGGLAQNLQSVSFKEDDFQVEGLIGLKGCHSKAYQFIYVNNRLVLANEMHKVVNAIFTQSNFGPLASDALSLRSPTKSKKFNSPRKTGEKHPIFCFQIRCPPNAYDVCLDPAKNVFEFENWPWLLSSLKIFVLRFLYEHNFLTITQLRLLEASAFTGDLSKNSMVRRPSRGSMELAPTFDDILGIRGSGRVRSCSTERIIFKDEELKGGGVNKNLKSGKADKIEVARLVATVGDENNHAVLDDQDFTIRTDMNAYIQWTDPLTKKMFFVDKRTGNSYTTIPAYNQRRISSTTSDQAGTDIQSKVNSQLVDRSRLRTTLNRAILSKSGEASVSIGGVLGSIWAYDILKKWAPINTVFQTTQQPVPIFDFLSTLPSSVTTSITNPKRHQSSSSLIPLAITSKFFTNSGIESEELMSKITKEGLCRAQVLCQVDEKFILTRLPGKSKSNNQTDCTEAQRDLLVLIDQHAADERIKVEVLMKEMARTSMSAGEDNIGPVALKINPAIKVMLTSREWMIIQKFEDHFNRWGIFLSRIQPKISTDIIVGSISSGGTGLMTRTTSRHFDSAVKSKSSTEQACSETIDPTGVHLPIYVTHLPKLIADRCVADPRIIEEILRLHLYRLDEMGAAVRSDGGNDESEQDETTWIKRLRTCPRGVLEILNSKACRSAVMFNDKLSLDQSCAIVKALTECVFPFQCAHGRPSMIPIFIINNETCQGVGRKRDIQWVRWRKPTTQEKFCSTNIS